MRLQWSRDADPEPPHWEPAAWRLLAYVLAGIAVGYCGTLALTAAVRR